MRDFDEVFYTVISGNPYSTEGVTHLSTYNKRNRKVADYEVTYFNRTADERMENEWSEEVGAFDFID